jgi:hypothetical protein
MKHNFSINRLTLAFASLLLSAVFLSSCSDVFPAGEDFVVIKVESHKRGIYKYHLTSIKGKGGFFMETDKLYQRGDTLSVGLNCR